MAADNVSCQRRADVATRKAPLRGGTVVGTAGVHCRHEWVARELRHGTARMDNRVLGLHVLVVSAGPVVGHMLRDRLQVEGAAVSVADTAGAALALVQANRFDAVVIELGLPDMNDVLVAALATHGHCGMRIAAISRTPGDDLARAIAAGADRVFPTPLDWHRLLWYLERGPLP